MKEYEVEFEGDTAVLLRGRRRKRTARVLGRECGSDGIERVWLDRLVIGPGESINGWSHSGAVSSVLAASPD